MGQVKFSGLVTGIKGKIGGTVFQSGKTGYTAKNNSGVNRKGVVGKGGVARMKQRIQVNTLATFWGSLSVEEREAWQNEAVNYTFYNRFGDPYTPSGYQLFMSLNLNLIAVEEAPKPSPEKKGEIFPITAFSVVNKSISEFKVTWAAPAQSKFAIIISGTPQRRVGKGIAGQSFGKITSILSNVSRPQDITNAMIEKYSQLQIGAEIWLKVEVVNTETGQRSAPFYTQVILDA